MLLRQSTVAAAQPWPPRRQSSHIHDAAVAWPHVETTTGQADADSLDLIPEASVANLDQGSWKNVRSTYVAFGDAMSAIAREILSGRCAYCGESLVSTAIGVVAWRAGNQFVCNEFCADGVTNDLVNLQPAERPGIAKLPPRK
jgi:hypothetical protein